MVQRVRRRLAARAEHLADDAERGMDVRRIEAHEGDGEDADDDDDEAVEADEGEDAVRAQHDGAEDEQHEERRPDGRRAGPESERIAPELDHGRPQLRRDARHGTSFDGRRCKRHASETVTLNILTHKDLCRVHPLGALRRAA